MAYRIFWTPIAVQDLRDICDFISRDNLDAAQRMGEELIKQSEAMAALKRSWAPSRASFTTHSRRISRNSPIHELN
jgi:plasmid stabilization system protein ParE